MDYNYGDIGNKIRSERKSKGWSQGALAEKLHYGEKSRQMVGRWEKGNEIPTLDNALKLCELFDCELGYLLCEPGYTCKTGRKTDVQEVTGLSEKTIEKLMFLHKSGYFGREKYNHMVLSVLNELFDKDFCTLLLDTAIFLNEMENLKQDETTSDDMAVAMLVGNRGKERLPGTAVLLQKDYYDFKVQQLEREFGGLLRQLMKSESMNNEMV